MRRYESSPRRKYNNNAVTLWSSRGTDYFCKDYFITCFERFFNLNFFSKDYGNLCGGKTQCTVLCAWQDWPTAANIANGQSNAGKDSR